MATLAIIDGAIIQGPPPRLIGRGLVPIISVATGYSVIAAWREDAQDGNLDAPDRLPAGCCERYETEGARGQPWAMPSLCEVRRY